MSIPYARTFVLVAWLCLAVLGAAFFLHLVTTSEAREEGIVMPFFAAYRQEVRDNILNEFDMELKTILTAETQSEITQSERKIGELIQREELSKEIYNKKARKLQLLLDSGLDNAEKGGLVQEKVQTLRLAQIRLYAESATRFPDDKEYTEAYFRSIASLGPVDDELVTQKMMVDIEKLRFQASTYHGWEVAWRIELAKYYMNTGLYGNALSLLGQANIVDGNSPEVHYLAAISFEGIEEIQNAIMEATLASRLMDDADPRQEEMMALIDRLKATENEVSDQL